MHICTSSDQMLLIVVGPFPGPYASRSYVHWAAL
jgi:hypothetical protein